VWAVAGRDRKTVEAFLDALGDERCQQLALVSCEMAAWIAGPIAERCPNAVRCVDPFHVIQLAREALDQIRREVWNEARRAAQTQLARDLKGRALRALEEPRAPHRPPAGQARRHRADEPTAVPCLPAQGTAQADLPAARHCRDRVARRLAEVGAALPPATVRQARQNDQRAARRHPRRDRARPLQRPRRSDQHPDPADHPPRLRLPLSRRPDRARDARPRRPLPAATTVNDYSNDPRKRQELPKTAA
jgi:transposase